MWVEHILARYRIFNPKILYFYWHTFYLLRKNLLTDHAIAAVALNLQFKLVKVDVLEVHGFFPSDNAAFLGRQRHINYDRVYILKLDFFLWVATKTTHILLKMSIKLINY